MQQVSPLQCTQNDTVTTENQPKNGRFKPKPKNISVNNLLIFIILSALKSEKKRTFAPQNCITI